MSSPYKTGDSVTRSKLPQKMPRVRHLLIAGNSPDDIRYQSVIGSHLQINFLRSIPGAKIISTPKDGLCRTKRKRCCFCLFFDRLWHLDLCSSTINPIDTRNYTVQLQYKNREVAADNGFGVQSYPLKLFRYASEDVSAYCRICRLMIL